MNFLVTLMAAVTGGGFSAVTGFVSTLLFCEAMHLPDGEGTVGYAAISAGFLLGMAGMILSIVLTLRWRHATTAAVAHRPLALGQ